LGDAEPDHDERPHLLNGVGPLRDRDFQKLFAAHLVSWFGTSMVPIAMTFNASTAPANTQLVLSRVSAYDASGSIALAPLGLVAAGFLLESIGARATLLIAMLLIVLPTALALVDADVRGLRFDSRRVG
jgi:hypothetical protein